MHSDVGALPRTAVGALPRAVGESVAPFAFAFVLLALLVCDRCRRPSEIGVLGATSSVSSLAGPRGSGGSRGGLPGTANLRSPSEEEITKTVPFFLSGGFRCGLLAARPRPPSETKHPFFVWRLVRRFQEAVCSLRS